VISLRARGRCARLGGVVAYRQDLKKAARRHLKSGLILLKATCPGAQPGATAVAGYMFGLAGELAIKQMMRDSGMKELPPESRRDDPFYAHFPTLKSLLVDAAKGRRHGELRKLAEDPRLFRNWDTDMRYAPTEDIDEDWVAIWKKSAEELVRSMDLP
jgi:hypothetical protein